MYIYFRGIKLLLTAKKDPSIGIWDEVQTSMIAWPSDIDIFFEVNNGRYLTLMDIGRFEYGIKIGLVDVLRRRNWVLAVGGSSIRYRKRILLFQKFVIHTKLAAIDERWVYFQQVIKRHGKWHTAALLRTAVTDENGIVPTKEISKELGTDWEYRMPEWVKCWDESDQIRPWGNEQAGA